MVLQSINPATKEIIAIYQEMKPEQWQQSLKLIHDDFLKWRETDFATRSRLMRNLAKALRSQQQGYARLITEEMGKPISQSLSEIEKCAWACDHFADHAEKLLQDEPVATEAGKSFVTFQPLGIVLGIMPWNFPFWQAFRFLAPTLMAGNAIALKHASNVSGCALEIEALCRKAGFPEHLFRTLLISSRQTAPVIAHPLVQAVTLTGSTKAGKDVAARAGAVLKKTVLELGGSDAYLILEDADLEQSAEICANSRCLNTGQSCISAKRFIIVDKIYDEFENLFVEKMKSRTMGDPLLETTQLGPLARLDLRQELHGQVQDSVKGGAKLLLGGTLPAGKGAFYPPTVLANVKRGMPAYSEELFGPVAALIRVPNEDEAIRVANDTNYGLGSSVFTRDSERGERIARNRLISGNVFVNDLVRSDPRLPFGGVKESGYGRELSVYGLREFVNIKTVWVR